MKRDKWQGDWDRDHDDLSYDDPIGVYGGGKGGGGSTTTVQKADPWKGQQRYLSTGFDAALNIFNSGGPQYYPNQTYAGFSPQAEMGLGMMQNRALQGSAFNNNAQGLAADTLGGAYLNSNPYLDATFNNARDAVTSGVNAQFSGAGRTGSGAHAGQLGDSLGQLATNIYGGNYQNERANQMAMLGHVPMLQQQSYADMDRLMAVGGAVEDRAQQAIDDQVNRFNYYQNLPEQNLARYIAAIQGNYGGTTSTTGPDNSGGALSTANDAMNLAKGGLDLYKAWQAI
jgi:hypothetical protein